MLLRPTVFVLGAGASKDFNFPIGIELAREIVALEPGNSQRDHLLELGWSQREIDRFREALRYSADTSVDAFLEKRPEFMDIGKQAMAIKLIAREMLPAIFPTQGPSTTWLRYLFGRLQGSSLQEFGENPVSFFTFNYDRVLEQYLFTALSNSWGRPDEEVTATLNKIPIIHLHGQLGFLPWQSGDGTNRRPFEPTINKQTVGVAACGIKVVHEGVEDRAEQFAAAKAAIKKADRTYFLGLGTGNVNLTRIGADDFDGAKAWATESGLTDAEYDAACKRYNPRIDFRRHFNCLQLISNFVQWD